MVLPWAQLITVQDPLRKKDEQNNVKYPTKLFNTTDALVFFLGQKQFSEETFKGIKIVYAIYNYTLIAAAVIFIIFELISFKNAFGDMTTLVSEIGLLFTHLVGMGKLWILAHKKAHIDEIKNKLQDKQYQYTPLDDFQPGLKMRKGKLLAVFVATASFILYSFVGVSAHIGGIISLQKTTKGDTFTGKSSCEAILPYNYYYPFDLSTVMKCHISLVYMDVSLDIFAWYILAMDMYFITLLHFLTIQLNILADAFTTIRKRCLHRMEFNSDFEVLNDADYPQLEEEMYKEMTQCTKHLHSLLETHKGIEAVFTFITLAQTLASLLIFASCLFVATNVPLNSPRFYSQLEYFSAVLFQFSLYCWFGNQMTIAGSAIPSALYNSDWYSCSPRFKKSMLLTMHRMQRPLFVSIGKFAPLSLTTLLAVIKGSFSYFTVFQTAGEE